MPIWARSPSSMGACRSGAWCVSSTALSTKPPPSICLATCSTSGTNGNIPFRRASRASSERFPNSPTWAWKCIISPATTTYGYLEQECGVILHKKPLTTEIYDKVFFLDHGDGLGDPNKKFKLVRRIFHSPTCQRLFSTLHPRWAMWFGLTWAKHSRLKRADGHEPPYMGEDKEYLVKFTKEYMKTHSNVDYYIYGHRHIELDLMLSHKTRMIILGDWIWQFSYVVFDGEHLFLSEYVEGESQM